MKKTTINLLIIGCAFVMMACGGGNKSNNAACSILIDDWTHKFEPKAVYTVPVELVNRSTRKWKDSVHVYLKKDNEVLAIVGNYGEIKKGDTLNLSFDLPLPEAEGDYEVVAEYKEKDGRPIRSRRLIEVDKPIIIDI